MLLNLTDADAVATQWNIVGARMRTASRAMNGGDLGKSILGINPSDAPGLLGATITAALFDTLQPQNNRKYSSDEGNT